MNWHLRAALDYTEGESVADIAARLRLSEQRVYQILGKVGQNLFGVFGVTLLRFQPEKVVARVRASQEARYYDKNTPEGHYYEILNEPRKLNADI